MNWLIQSVSKGIDRNPHSMPVVLSESHSGGIMKSWLLIIVLLLCWTRRTELLVHAPEVKQA